MDKYYIELFDASHTRINNYYTTSTSLQIGPLDYSSSYSWKAKAENSAGWGPYCSEWSFTTESESVPVEKSWFQQISGVDDRLNSVDAVSQQVGWTCGRYTVVLRTTDSGETWTDASGDMASHSFASIDALDENTALVTGYNYDTERSYIHKTTDGGSTWTDVYGQDHAIHHICMFDALNGRAVGDPMDNSWTVLETTDGGDTWSMLDSCPSAAEGDCGYYCSVSWYSTEGGWLGTNTSKAYHTPDRGASWFNQPIPELVRVRSIAFEPEGVVGVACSGSDEHMARTTDSGAAWENITPPQEGIIYYMHHADNGFWTLIDESVYSSDNDGDDWDHETTATADLRDISFHGSNENRTGWAVGNGGVIMRYGTETTAVKSYGEENIRPESMMLYQNYPNPFNPTTTIQFQLKEAGFVELKIFDLRGKEIETLMKESKDKGVYNCVWDAKDLPSGIYLYRLKVGDHIETKKLILQK